MSKALATYGELLQSPFWQKKRLKIFERDNYACQSCNRMDIQLHVHHLKYFYDSPPWEIADHYLITYCELCHNTEHLIGNQIHESLLSIIRDNRLLVRPVAQLCILADKSPEFFDKLKKFLDQSLIEFNKTKSLEHANPTIAKI